MWIGDNLYKSGFAQAIVNGDATVGNAFVQAIDKIRLALGNKKSRSHTNLAVAERLFMRALENEVQTREGDVEYSINDKFYEQLDNWDGKTIGFSFVVGVTSKALQQAGVPKKQIRWDASKIAALLKKHNGMTIDTIKQIPELLENPILVIDSKKEGNSKIVMGDVYDENNKIVTVVLLLTPTSKKGNVLDLIKISSAEGRSHIKSLFTNEDKTLVPVRYVDKKRIQGWLNVNRLQLPLHNLDPDSNTTIAEIPPSVKNYSMQNAPKNSSSGQKAIVNKAWMQGDASVDREGNTLDEGEQGPKKRQFYEKRERGTDANQSEAAVEKLKEHSETYTPVSNQETLEKAKEKLRNPEYSRNLQRRILKLNKNDMFNSVDVAAAEVMINGTPGVMGILVKETGKNHYKSHRILMPDGSAFVYQEMKNAEPTSASMIASKSDEGLAIGSASNTRLSQNDPRVNTQSMQNAPKNSSSGQLSFLPPEMMEQESGRKGKPDVYQEDGERKAYLAADRRDTSSVTADAVPPSPQGEGYDGAIDENGETIRKSNHGNKTAMGDIHWY